MKKLKVQTCKWNETDEEERDAVIQSNQITYMNFYVMFWLQTHISNVSRRDPVVFKYNIKMK